MANVQKRQVQWLQEKTQISKKEFQNKETVLVKIINYIRTLQTVIRDKNEMPQIHKKLC